MYYTIYMQTDYWLKQDKETPLFPGILWSRPEHKQTAGKLLIIGGNLHGFIDVGISYQRAVQAGAGTVKVLLPDALQKIVGATLENCEYAPSTPSGSFAKTALTEFLSYAQWADCVLLAGEFGRNSETAILLEEFVQKYSGPLCITRDALEYFYASAKAIVDRPATMIIGATGQLQKLAMSVRFTSAITTSLDLIRMSEVLRDFSTAHQAIFVTHQLGTTFVSEKGRVSSTKTGSDDDIWRIPTAAAASVFWMQNPSQGFEAVTTSLIYTN